MEVLPLHNVCGSGHDPFSKYMVEVIANAKSVCEIINIARGEDPDAKYPGHGFVLCYKFVSDLYTIGRDDIAYLLCDSGLVGDDEDYDYFADELCEHTFWDMLLRVAGHEKAVHILRMIYRKGHFSFPSLLTRAMYNRNFDLMRWIVQNEVATPDMYVSMSDVPLDSIVYVHRLEPEFVPYHEVTIERIHQIRQVLRKVLMRGPDGVVMQYMTMPPLYWADADV